jgi:F-type H+-transporting ATPase subunit gamma
MQITSAMKMVSAAKLKKAQDAITSMRPYANTLTVLLQNLSATLEGDSGSKFADRREVNKIFVVAITSNRGLAGAFNSSIVKESRRCAEETYAGKQVSFVTLGKKGNDILRKTDTIVENNNSIFDELTYENAADIAEKLMALFEESACDKIVLVYNKFKNAATQIVMNEQFLPIVASEENDDEDNSPSKAQYIFEPSKEKIVAELIPKSLKTQLFKALRDSVASEHGARMTAMHKATDNAIELRDQLKLQYNKARQAAITNEILEIVGGAEALAG